MVPRTESWKETPSALVIGEDEVHVWRARLDESPSTRRDLEEILGTEEMSRAQRFRFPVHRNRFVSRRAALRLLLGQHLKIAPADVRFEYTPHGKPVLARHHGTDLRFNLSHSQELALLVLTRARDAGIDIEFIRPGVCEESIPERYFTAREAAALRALPLQHQPDAFFNLWVRKEAYIKAQGLGLSLALDSFDVPLETGDPAGTAWPLTGPQDAPPWTMRALFPGAGYAAAVVAEGRDWNLRCWTFALTREKKDARRARIADA